MTSPSVTSPSSPVRTKIRMSPQDPERGLRQRRQNSHFPTRLGTRRRILREGRASVVKICTSLHIHWTRWILREGHASTGKIHISPYVRARHTRPCERVHPRTLQNRPKLHIATPLDTRHTRSCEKVAQAWANFALCCMFGRSTRSQEGSPPPKKIRALLHV